jgi:hypothetical protein
MATPYRQPIWPGDEGADVKAVKRAFQRMGIQGSGGLVIDNRAGPQFVLVLDRLLRQHGLRADHEYGPQAHALVAPHFDLYGVSLYRKARIRTHKPPPLPVFSESAKQAALELLQLRELGRYRADNPGDLRDLQATADGKHVWSQGGYYVMLDPRPLRLLVWLIRMHGYRLGTFALCSDHHFDGQHGHSGGLAVDISSINDIALASDAAHGLARAVASTIRNSSNARPWQLITAGTGYVWHTDLEGLCIPSASFYGWTTLSEHRNHIHVGYR